MKRSIKHILTIPAMAVIVAGCGSNTHKVADTDINAVPTTASSMLQTVVDGDTMDFCKLEGGNVALKRWYNGGGKTTLTVPAEIEADGHGYTVTQISGDALCSENVGNRPINLNIPATVEKIGGVDTFYPDGVKFGTITVDAGNSHFKTINNVLYTIEEDSLLWGTLNQSRPVRLMIPHNLKITGASMHDLAQRGDKAAARLKNISAVTIEPGHPTMMMIDNRLYNTRDGYMLLNLNPSKQVVLPNFCLALSEVIPINFEQVTFDDVARGEDIFSVYLSMIGAYAGLPMKFIWLNTPRDIEPMDMGAIKMFSDLVLRQHPTHIEARRLNNLILENYE